MFAIVITGPPGAGKSAVLTALADALCDDNIPHAAVEVEALVWAHPALTDEQAPRHNRTIRLLYRDAGYDLLLLAPHPGDRQLEHLGGRSLGVLERHCDQRSALSALSRSDGRPSSQGRGPPRTTVDDDRSGDGRPDGNPREDRASGRKILGPLPGEPALEQSGRPVDLDQVAVGSRM